MFVLSVNEISSNVVLSSSNFNAQISICEINQEIKNFTDQFGDPVSQQFSIKSIAFSILVDTFNFIELKVRKKNRLLTGLDEVKSNEIVISCQNLASKGFQSFHDINSLNVSSKLLDLLGVALNVFKTCNFNVADQNSTIAFLEKSIRIFSKKDLNFLSSEVRNFQTEHVYEADPYLELRIAAKAHRHLMYSLVTMTETYRKKVKDFLSSMGSAVQENRMDLLLKEIFNNEFVVAHLYNRCGKNSNIVSYLLDILSFLYNDYSKCLVSFNESLCDFFVSDTIVFCTDVVNSNHFNRFILNNGIELKEVIDFLFNLKGVGRVIEGYYSSMIKNLSSFDLKLERLQFFVLYLLVGDVSKIPSENEFNVIYESSFFILFKSAVLKEVDFFVINQKDHMKGILKILNAVPVLKNLYLACAKHKTFNQDLKYMVEGALKIQLEDVRRFRAPLDSVKKERKVRVQKETKSIKDESDVLESPQSVEPPPPPDFQALRCNFQHLHEVELFFLQILKDQKNDVIQVDSLENALSHIQDSFVLINESIDHAVNNTMTKEKYFVYHQQLCAHLSLFVERLVASHVPKDKDQFHDLLSLIYDSKRKGVGVLYEDEYTFLNEMNGLELYSRNVVLYDTLKPDSSLKMILLNSLSKDKSKKRQTVELHYAFANVLRYIYRSYKPFDTRLESMIERYTRLINRPHIETVLGDGEIQQDELFCSLEFLKSAQLNSWACGIRNNLFQNHLLQLSCIKEKLLLQHPQILKVTLSSVVQLSQYVLEDVLFIYASVIKIHLNPKKLKHDLVELLKTVKIPMKTFSKDERELLASGKGSRFLTRYLERAGDEGSERTNAHLKKLDEALRVAKRVSEPGQPSEEDISRVTTFILNELNLLESVIRKIRPFFSSKS